MKTSKRTLSLIELAVLSLLGTLLFVVQVALAVLPNIELVSVMLIVYARVYGWKTFYPVYIFVALEILRYGFASWVINYIYVWAILVLVVVLLRRFSSRWLWVLVGTAFGLLFGALCSVIYLFAGGVPAMIAYWVSGIPFDFLHAGGNFVTVLLLAEPLYKLLHRLKQQFV